MKTQTALQTLRFSILTVPALLLALTAGAQEAGVEKDSIKVGIIGPLTGATATNGKAILAGTKAYLKRINDKGGVNGRKINLISVDDEYEPRNTAAAAQKLVEQDKVFSLLSIFGGPTTQAVLPFVDKMGVPLIGPVSAANISDPVHKWVFAVRPNSLHEAEMIVTRLRDDLGIREEIGVLYQDDAFGKSSLTAVNNALQKSGARALVTAPIQRNSSDVEKAVDTLAAKKPKAVLIFANYPATAAFVKKAYEKNFKPIFVGPTSLPTPGFLKETESLVLTTFAVLVVPAHTDTSLAIVKQYQEDMAKAGETDLQPFSLEGYINAAIFVEGLVKAGKEPTREGLRKALESLNDVDLGGVKFSYSATDHQGFQSPVLTKIKDGKLVSVPNMK